MHKGQTVTMSRDALDNYGAKWAGVELIVTHVATKYMPAKEFFAQGKPDGYHPGYDETGGKLYDLKRKDTDEALGMSLYDWELQAA